MCRVNLGVDSYVPRHLRSVFLDCSDPIRHFSPRVVSSGGYSQSALPACYHRTTLAKATKPGFRADYRNTVSLPSMPEGGRLKITVLLK